MPLTQHYWQQDCSQRASQVQVGEIQRNRHFVLY